MGMFDKKDNSKKCNCPHCRGGSHEPLFSADEFFYNGGQELDITEEISSIDLVREDPSEIVEQYIEAILECESPDEVNDVMYAFFDDVFVHAMQETYITEIEAKIQALQLIRDGFVLEEDNED